VSDFNGKQRQSAESYLPDQAKLKKIKFMRVADWFLAPKALF
jgi:hypothetical protein